MLLNGEADRTLLHSVISSPHGMLIHEAYIYDNSTHVHSGSFWALVLIIIFKYKYTCTCIMTPRSGCCLLILTVCLRDPNLTMANVGAKSCFLLNVSPSKLCYWWTHWCRIYSYSQSWSAPTHYKHTQLQGNTTGYIIYAHLLK